MEVTMPEQPSVGGRSCPHCGKRTGLSLLALLPAPNTDDDFKCRACGGHFKLAERTRLWSLGGGLLALLPVLFLFGHFGAKWSAAITAAVGVAVTLIAFGLGSIALGWLTLRLERRR
jgi:hypothetical protein